MPRHTVTLLVLLDTLPLELNGIAISHHSDEDFSQRQVVETSKSLASGTFLPREWTPGTLAKGTPTLAGEKLFALKLQVSDP